MANAPTIGALLVTTVPLKLAVNEGEATEIKLDLKLAWTMKAVMLMEAKCREFGVYGVNILQDPSGFWNRMDCTVLAIAVWSLSQQEHWKQYGEGRGFDTIASFLVAENYLAATKAVKAAYVASLSDKRRKELEEAEAKEAAGKTAPSNPTPAPSQV